MKFSAGSNINTAHEAFVYRQQYAFNYPPGIRDYRRINFWYNEMLFGRVDQAGNVVYPSEAFLKQLFTTNQHTYFVLNFVADAYEAFRNTIRTQEAHNHFLNVDGTPFAKRFEPTRAWISINENYNTYIQDYYDSFVLPFMASSTRKDDIKSFDDFIMEFTRLIDRTSLLVPFTKTEYIVSKYGSPLTSGLVVEFATKDHGDDSTKISDFVNNINFELYREVASQNGFAVDMNAPWRLIADIGSDAMQRFMKEYDQSLDTVFDAYYYKSSYFDIPNLKVYLSDFYDGFVRAFPTIHTPHVGEATALGLGTEAREHGARNISLTTVRDRDIMSPEDYKFKYNNLFWIRLCIFIRAKETNQNWDQHKFDHVVKRASEFYMYSTEIAMLKFIKKELERDPGEYFLAEPRRRGSFDFKRKRA
jgi:hypothetical protein